MKHVLQTMLVLMSLTLAIQLPAQSALKKANKEYELFAFNLAIKSYRKVLSKDSDNVEAIARMADCYRHLNQIDDAIHWFKKAVDMDGIDPVYVFYYAQALMNKGDYEEAKKYFLLFAEGQPIFGNHYAESCDFAISMRGIPALYRVKNEYANTPVSDFGPSFYKDMIVYSSSRTDLGGAAEGSSNWGGGASNQCLVTARDQNGFLERPKLLHDRLSINVNEGPLSYTADGSIVAYTKNNFVEGTRQIPSSGVEMSIYFGEVSSDGDWSNPKPFAYNGSGYSSGYPSLSADGEMMFFASNRPDGYGGYDIYVTYRIGETWTSPENLGPKVNSPGNELSPFFDGRSLYFSSDWHYGMGGLDIFRAEKVDELWDKIFHLGNGVNSSRDDYSFIFDNQNNIGYFTSNRLGGKGREDIYQLTKMTDNIEITVLDAADRRPVLGANVDFSACGESVFQTDQNGQYNFQAVAGLNCEVSINKTGYVSYAFNVSSSGKRETLRFQVLLSKEADKYIGRVFDAVDNSAVEETYVIATNQNTNQRIETKTDANGAYHLALLPNTDYVIRFSKAGYLDTYNRISVGDGSDKGILDNVRFQPSGMLVNTPSSGPSPVDTPDSSEETSDIADTPSVPATEVETTEESLPQIEQGYSVQIAAVYGDEKVVIEKYDELKSVGNLYSRPEKGYKKVRVGIFETKAEASEARKAIRERGFDKAFVVLERLEDMVDVEFYYEPVVLEETPEPVVEEPVIETPPVVEEVPVMEENSVAYKVRLASYRNPDFFNQQLVNGIGQVERIKRGTFTVMLLSGYTNLQEAIDASEEAVKSGFADAHVVLDDNGRLVKVNL
ncbi:MAG: carboxypeptidase regulatory-like domain-containing protein [Bacteroidota bacterium]